AATTVGKLGGDGGHHHRRTTHHQRTRLVRAGVPADEVAWVLVRPAAGHHDGPGRGDHHPELPADRRHRPDQLHAGADTAVPGTRLWHLPAPPGIHVLPHRAVRRRPHRRVLEPPVPAPDPGAAVPSHSDGARLLVLP